MGLCVAKIQDQSVCNTDDLKYNEAQSGMDKESESTHPHSPEDIRLQPENYASDDTDSTIYGDDEVKEDMLQHTETTDSKNNEASDAIYPQPEFNVRGDEVQDPENDKGSDNAWSLPKIDSIEHKVHDNVQQQLQDNLMNGEVQEQLSENSLKNEELDQLSENGLVQDGDQQSENSLKNQDQQLENGLKNGEEQDDDRQSENTLKDGGIQEQHSENCSKNGDEQDEQLENGFKDHKHTIQSLKQDDDIQEELPPESDDTLLIEIQQYSSHIEKVSFETLPKELLVKILLYLPTDGKLRMRCVSRKFREVAEIPLLWRKFVMPYFHFLSRKPHNFNAFLNMISEHVREIRFPYKVPLEVVLTIVSFCTKVTNLIFDQILELHDLNEIICKTRPQCYLDVIAHDGLVKDVEDEYYSVGQYIEELLKINVGRIRRLTLESSRNINEFISAIRTCANLGYPFPPTINICTLLYVTACERGIHDGLRQLFEWSMLNYNQSSFEIVLYDTERVPMDLHPPVPVRKYKFGPAAKHPLIRLSDHGIAGLQQDVFHVSEYVLIPDRDDVEYQSLNEERHFDCFPDLHFVTYVDIACENVEASHLQKLAMVCPNLQQLYLNGNVKCLENLEGLRSIIRTCRNLKCLSLVGISVTNIESYVLFWELLSNIKKLSLLYIESCMLKLYSFSDDIAQKLVALCKGCHNLQALVIFSDRKCTKCNPESQCNHTRAKFLFPHYPSLAYCLVQDVECPTVITHAIRHCRHLKYLYEYRCGPFNSFDGLFPLSKNIHLQEINIVSALKLTFKSAEALCAHGQLKSVTLHINSISIKGVTTIFFNSKILSLDIQVVHLLVPRGNGCDAPELMEQWSTFKRRRTARVAKSHECFYIKYG